LFSGLLHAQDDEGVADTTIVDTETTVTTEEVATDAPLNPYDREKKNYFQYKWNYSAWDSLRMRKLPDSAVVALQRDEDFWYANYVFPKKEEKANTKPRSKINFYDILLWFLIIGGFVAFLAIYLINSNVGLFRRSKTLKGEEWDTELEDIFSINYNKEIEKAVNAGNYRLAVRLMFLRTLRNLSDKNIIQYKQDRTNFDYLMQLSNTIWYKPFLWLARNYEYVWYGKFNIDEKQFDIIKDEFNNLQRQL
jgi:hypothetical protein